MSEPQRAQPADCPCPVCGADGRRARADLAALDCTCDACGWHYTSHAAREATRAELVRLQAEEAADATTE